MAAYEGKDVSEMSVRELKHALAQVGGSAAGCLEKKELQDRLVHLLASTPKGHNRSSCKAEPIMFGSGECTRQVTPSVHGQLDCVVIQGGVPVGGLQGVLSVVLLHGYGANKEDLAPIGDAIMHRLVPLAARKSWAVRFLVPDAPFTLQGPSRQWWPIDMMKLAMAAMNGQLDAVWDENPDESSNSCSTERVTAFLEREIDAVQELSSTSVKHRIVLAGFSQGAMLAANVALRQARRLPEMYGLCLFSSAMIARQEWIALAKGVGARDPPLKVFQSHGTADPIVPFSAGVELKQLLESGGIRCDFVRFAGQHTILPEAVSGFENLLIVALDG